MRIALLSYSTKPRNANEACKACVIVMRRDFRDPSDRQRRVFVDESAQVTEIDSVSWQW